MIFAVVSVGVFMSTLDGSIVNVALPTIMADLDSPLAVTEWVMMIYLLVVSALLLSFGHLSDLLGRREVFGKGLLVFSAGSMTCGLSSTATALIAARAFQGIGAAMIMSCTQAIIAESFPLSQRGKALGLLGAIVASGLTVGPPLGGLLIKLSSWQTIFFINIPIGLLTAYGAYRVLEKQERRRKSTAAFDWLGACLMALAMGSFLFIVTHGHDRGFTDSTILALIFVFSGATIWLIRNEIMVAEPIFSLSLLKIRLFIFPVISAMILFASLFSIVFLMPFYLMHPCGYGADETGYTMVNLFLFLFIFAPVAGILSDKIGSRSLCTFGMMLLTLSIFMLARLSPELDRIEVAWRLGLAGIGIAIFHRTQQCCGHECRT
jgi:EmrB/QacA subfamily drug resistance transporter